MLALPPYRNTEIKKAPESFCKNLPDHLKDVCDILDSTREKYCGRILRTTLADLCNSTYLSPGMCHLFNFVS